MQTYAQDWLVLFLDASIKGLLLAAAVWGIERALRIRSPQLRHQLWLGVLGAMLALPLLSQILPPIATPVWLPAVGGTAASAQAGTALSGTAVGRSSAMGLPARIDASEMAVGGPGLGESSFASGSEPLFGPGIVDGGGDASQEFSAAATATTGDRLAAAPVASADPETTTIGAGRLLFAVWLAGAGLLGARLMLGGWMVHQLRRTATPLQQPGGSAGAIRTPVFESRQVHVPVLVGVWRPVILLPDDWRTWSGEKLRAVLAHEEMHAARRDGLTMWLSHVNGCLYWLHPAAWWLKRRLSDLAELACDEAAIAATGDRCGYARCIVEIAAAAVQRGGRTTRWGVAMARVTGLEQRIEEILKNKEPSRDGFSRRARWACGAVMTVAVLLLGALQPATAVDEPQAAETVSAPGGGAASDVAQGARQVAGGQADEAPEVGAGAEAAGAEGAGPGPAAALVTMSGRVLDMDSPMKSPLPGVQVWLFEVRDDEGDATQVAETRTNGLGRFEFRDLEPVEYSQGILKRYYIAVCELAGRPIAVGFLFPEVSNGIPLYRESGELTGVVVDPQGRPVTGARVTAGGVPSSGVLGDLFSTMTDANGEFSIPGLPVVSGDGERPAKTAVVIVHPDYPELPIEAPAVPADVQLAFVAGGIIEGQVVDDVTGQPVAGAQVLAMPRTSSPSSIRRTDADGRFKFALRQDVYDLVADAPDRICLAASEIECRVGKTIAVPPIRAVQGGWIEGRVFDTRTGRSVGVTDQGRPIEIGVYGPSAPWGGVIRPEGVAQTNADGTFRLDTAPGENFPYLVNQQGERMAWDTREQPAVVVRAGETTPYDMRITPPLSPREEMTAALAVLDTLPAELAPRTEALLQKMDATHFTRDTFLGAVLLRELVRQGRDAVPIICARLDRTISDNLLRQLAFALRAIGDPRAAPSLIRALPQTVGLSIGDYGLIVEDKELMDFLQTHDRDVAVGGHFAWSSADQEIAGTLEKLTGQNFSNQELHLMERRRDPRARTLQLQRQRVIVEKWRDWWEAHWNELTDDASLAKIELPPLDAPESFAAFDPDARAFVDGGLQGMVLSPPEEPGHHVSYFYDIDTGFEPGWPAEIEQTNSQADSRELLAWAAGEGVDLLCTIRTTDEGGTAYVLRGIDMQIEEIDKYHAQSLDRRLAEGKLPRGRLVRELLMHVDPMTLQPEPRSPAAFLCTTREGGAAVIEITDQIVEARDITGQPVGAPGIGFHRGVKFTIHTLTNVPPE